jgi:hypothetical protein
MILEIHDAKDFPESTPPSIEGVQELAESWSGDFNIFGSTTFTRKFLIKNDNIRAREALFHYFFPRTRYSATITLGEPPGYTVESVDNIKLFFYATPNFTPLGTTRSPIVRAVSATIKPLDNAKTLLPQRDKQNIPINNVNYCVFEVTFEHTGSYRSVKNTSTTDPKPTRLSQVLTEHFEITSEFKTLPNNSTFYWDDSQTLQVADTDISPTVLYSYTTWRYKVRYLPFDLKIDDLINHMNSESMYSHKLKETFDEGRVLLADAKSERFVNWDGIPLLNAEFIFLIMEPGRTWNQFPFKNSTEMDGDDDDAEWRSIYDEDGNIVYPYPSANLNRYVIDKSISDSDKEYTSDGFMWWE